MSSYQRQQLNPFYIETNTNDEEAEVVASWNGDYEWNNGGKANQHQKDEEEMGLLLSSSSGDSNGHHQNGAPYAAHGNYPHRPSRGVDAFSVSAAYYTNEHNGSGTRRQRKSGWPSSYSSPLSRNSGGCGASRIRMCVVFSVVVLFFMFILSFSDRTHQYNNNYNDDGDSDESNDATEVVGDDGIMNNAATTNLLDKNNNNNETKKDVASPTGLVNISDILLEPNHMLPIITPAITTTNTTNSTTDNVVDSGSETTQDLTEVEQDQEDQNQQETDEQLSADEDLDLIEDGNSTTLLNNSLAEEDQIGDVQLSNTTTNNNNTKGIDANSGV